MMRMDESTANSVEDAIKDTINKELETLEEGTVMVCQHCHHQNHEHYCFAVPNEYLLKIYYYIQ